MPNLLLYDILKYPTAGLLFTTGFNAKNMPTFYSIKK
jgi:hypothetical protein